MPTPTSLVILILLSLLFSSASPKSIRAHPKYCKEETYKDHPRTNEKKVFVVGLPKTGTTSVGEFFRLLCLKVIKHAGDLARADGDFKNFSTFNKAEVVTNSAEWYYADIEEQHKDDFLFIVTNRSKESWLHSARKHFCYLEWPFNDSSFQSFGVRVYHDGHFRRIFDSFYEQTFRYFEGRWGKDAFIVNTDELINPKVAKATMKQLAKVVGYQGPLPEKYPHSNQRSSHCQYSEKLDLPYIDPECIKTCSNFTKSNKR
mmetsp:Transcript_802/g.1360  ORF Transcript_802/g.1360 Transcript_802/m.1360 type:complete len:259 (-) Transcript_802:17-793(-)